jgi:hypothetical protein
LVQGQILAPDLVQEAISDQDNITKSPIHNQEIVPEKQTQQPQEQMSLRKSTIKEERQFWITL